jgi:hypothetical protein
VQAGASCRTAGRLYGRDLRQCTFLVWPRRHRPLVANGGTSIEDPPGMRQAAARQLYLAYLRNPEGNKLCGLYRVPA